ncbi:MAG: DUF3727 domain-containing protein [Elainellaceae cyanobacterium]
MAKDSSFNEDSENLLNPNSEVVVLSDGSGRSLPCYVEHSIEIDDQEYVLLMPIHIPIEIFAWDGDDDEDETLLDIPDEELDEVFPTARAVLAEQDMTLERTALTLTATGELPQPDDETLITLDLGEDEDEMSPEQLQLLAEFYFKDQKYSICTPTDPLLIFARVEENGEPKLLSPEEFQTMRPQLEDKLFDDL